MFCSSKYIRFLCLTSSLISCIYVHTPTHRLCPIASTHAHIHPQTHKQLITSLHNFTPAIEHNGIIAQQQYLHFKRYILEVYIHKTKGPFMMPTNNPPLPLSSFVFYFLFLSYTCALIPAFLLRL